MFDRHVLEQVKVLVRASNVGRRVLFGFGSWRCSRLVSIFLYEEFYETFILLGHVVAHADTNRAKFPGHKPRQVCVAFGICSVRVEHNEATTVEQMFFKILSWHLPRPGNFPPKVPIPNVFDECAVKMHRTALMQIGFNSFTHGVAPINWAEPSQHIKLHERTLHIDAWVGNVASPARITQRRDTVRNKCHKFSYRFPTSHTYHTCRLSCVCTCICYARTWISTRKVNAAAIPEV